MSNYNLVSRLIIYNEAYKSHLEDLKLCKENNLKVIGMCKLIKRAAAEFEGIKYSDYVFDLNNFPELKELRPSYQKEINYWWDSKDYEIRKHKFEILINL